MSRVEKPVYLTRHAEQQMGARGITIEEVDEAIRTVPWEPAQSGRWQCRKEYAYNVDWNGRTYSTKAVRPVFVDEERGIVVVTVYAYYF